MLQGNDALVLPALPSRVPTMAAPAFAGSRPTWPVNFAGLPALALPLAGAKPTSIQLIGAPQAKEQLLAIGKQLEAALRGCWQPGELERPHRQRLGDCTQRAPDRMTPSAPRAR